MLRIQEIYDQQELMCRKKLHSINGKRSIDRHMPLIIISWSHRTWATHQKGTTAHPRPKKKPSADLFSAHEDCFMGVILAMFLEEKHPYDFPETVSQATHWAMFFTKPVLLCNVNCGRF